MAASPPETPLSPSESQRSREMSWSSVYVTPLKLSQVRHSTRGPTVCDPSVEQTPQQPVYAPSATQRSARQYCVALFVAAVAAGALWSLASPVLLVLLGTDWR